MWQNVWVENKQNWNSRKKSSVKSVLQSTFFKTVKLPRRDKLQMGIPEKEALRALE